MFSGAIMLSFPLPLFAPLPYFSKLVSFLPSYHHATLIPQRRRKHHCANYLDRQTDHIVHKQYKFKKRISVKVTAFLDAISHLYKRVCPTVATYPEIFAQPRGSHHHSC